MNREEFFVTMSGFLNADELNYVQKAYWLVKEAHRRQHRRLTGERFFEHVRRVALMMAVDYGYCSGDQIALALLHDTIEDTFVPPSVIISMFGTEMYQNVMVLSKEIPSFDMITGTMVGRAKIPINNYYITLAKAGDFPRRVKGCDRIDNLADFAQWEPERRQKYIIETETHVLPIIYKTDGRMADEIRARLAA